MGALLRISPILQLAGILASKLHVTMAVCSSICGNGNQIMYPKAVISFTDLFGQERSLFCQQAQLMVQSGLAPVGFCSEIRPYAIVPCACVKPDGSLVADDPIPTTQPAPPPASPSPASTPQCPNRLQALNGCLSQVTDGDQCLTCVTSYWPTYATACDGIAGETCQGLLECPCGSCGVKFLRYVNCLAKPTCNLTCNSTFVDVRTKSPSMTKPVVSMAPTKRNNKQQTTDSPSYHTESERSIFSQGQRLACVSAVSIAVSMIAVVAGIYL